jgi:hypothetical protein
MSLGLRSFNAGTLEEVGGVVEDCHHARELKTHSNWNNSVASFCHQCLTLKNLLYL